MTRYPQQRRSPIVLLLFALCVIILGISTLLLISPAFRAREVLVEGIKTIPEEDVRAQISRFFEENTVRLAGFVLLPGDNILRVRASELSHALMVIFPKIDSVRVRRDIPPKLVITITERSPFAVWCTSQECFWMSRDGAIYEPAPRVSGTVVLSILDESEDQSIKLGSHALSSHAVDFIARVDEKFFEVAGVRAKEWHLSSASPNILLLKTEEGWEIRFSTERPAERELSVLKKLLDEIIRERKPELFYVDLRDATRLYYRYKSGGESTESHKGGQ